MKDIKVIKEARYRTKQINIVKTKGSISAHSTVECDYYLGLGQDNNEAIVRLDDSVYRLNAPGAESLESFIRTSDQIKKEMIYAIKADGSIADLLNQDVIQQKWAEFKTGIADSELLKDAEHEAVDQIVSAGDMEYYSKEILLKNSNTNLFNQVMFSQYLTRTESAFEAEEFETISHFFPQISFTVSSQTKQSKELIEQIKYEKRGKPVFIDIDLMIRLYEQMYREQLGFRFTDYLYDYEVKFTVSKHDGLIDYASVNISERVKNNLESQVIYELTRVEL